VWLAGLRDVEKTKAMKCSAILKFAAAFPGAHVHTALEDWRERQLFRADE